MRIRPLNDQVVIRPLEDPPASPLLVDTPLRQVPHVRYGECVAVGPGRWPKKGRHRQRLPMQAEAGKVYAFKKGDGLEVEDGSLLVMFERQLIFETETPEGQTPPTRGSMTQ